MIIPEPRGQDSMHDPTPSNPALGTQIGTYVITDLLGVGGMGRVFRARAADGSEVALKLVKADYAADDTFRKRFYLEARIAESVKHPNVVPVLATGEYEGLPYMVQKFVDGLSLEQRLKEQGPLDRATAVRICDDVAAGLEALWAAGMVHRDVKPGNIMLDTHGTAYITDFGLAKDTQGSVLTLPGQALGSMDYMAPEQIRGEDVTACSDIYALGCVMYESLSGRTPFSHVQGMRILWAHLQETPPDLRQFRPDLSEAFCQALMRALEKEPGDRPSRPTDYARSLDAAP
jgi:serine/threonine protein kinase